MDAIKQFLKKNGTKFTTNNEGQVKEILVDHVLMIQAEISLMSARLKAETI